MEHTIPEGSVEIQTGLWAYLRTFTYAGVSHSVYDIYSSDGYCFWDVNQAENYYEDGTLRPPTERMYYRVTYGCFESTIEGLNATYISVPIEEGFVLVNSIDDVETE